MSDDQVDALEAEVARREAIGAFCASVKAASRKCLDPVFYAYAGVIAQAWVPELGETEEEAEDFLAMCMGAGQLLRAND